MTRTNYFPFALLPAVLGLGACAQFGMGQPDDTVRPGAAAQVSVNDNAAVPSDSALTSAPPPPAAARTQEALDTTSAAQRAQAAAPAAKQTDSKLLGTTIASLGSPTEPGFWLKTPLVKDETKGRVTNKATGKSSAVTLIPIDGPASGGSRLSLPALRLIGASLTDLTEVEVTLEG
ncbi:hypothetical protein [uncultured Sulfitobacter sp.]|uniref:hypothetical protein n=1 Tax=uncultured Sulfitobacter sp. TaxID=191468 RepID=UPI00263623C2|nr:hypothetical protein [uncultured Sulfitobacter sp.]